jgi:hypothetical protein
MTKEKMPSYVIAVQGEKADGRVFEQTDRLTISAKKNPNSCVGISR